MLPRVIMLDADDTLIDHISASVAALKKVSKNSEVLGSVPVAELSELWSRDFRKYWRRLIMGETTILENRIDRFKILSHVLGQEFSNQEATLIAMDYGEEYIKSVRPVSGAIELLKSVKGRGMKITVVTDNIREMQEEKLSKCGFMEYIDEVILSEDYGIMKPDPELYKIALEKSGCKPSEAIMIGDSYESDIIGARSAGITPIMFRNGRKTKTTSDLSLNVLDSFVPTEKVLDYILEVFKSSYKN